MAVVDPKDAKPPNDSLNQIKQYINKEMNISKVNPYGYVIPPENIVIYELNFEMNESQKNIAEKLLIKEIKTRLDLFFLEEKKN